jgi:hypothetical protein
MRLELLLFILSALLSWAILLQIRYQAFEKYTGNFVPSKDNVYTLGTATNRWKSLDVGEGTIFITDATLGTRVAVTIDNGMFFIDGIAQAQLPNVQVSNLTFADASLQTTAYVAPSPTSYNPLFNTISGPSVSGVISTGSYTMITPKLCFYRVFVDFSTCTNFGTAIQYKIDLPFPSKATIRSSSGVLHQITGDTYYHIAGIANVNSEQLNLYYFASQTDLPWKSSTPVGGTTVTSHFDISGIYEIV